MTERQALSYPLARAHALIAQHIVTTVPVELVSKGYLLQEAERKGLT